MPFSSQAQWSWAFATGQPWAKRWADETPGGKGKRYRRLRARVATKAPNYGGKAGSVIVGNLARGGDGKFTSAGNASAAAPKPAKPAARRARAQARKPKAPKPTPEQRAAEREQAQTEQRRANEAKVATQAGLGQGLSDALLEFASPDEAIALAPQNAEALETAGLVERDRDGNPRLTPAGRSYVTAARAGDVSRARDALSRGSDRRQAGDERAAARAERQAERDRKRAEAEDKKRQAAAKPKKGGGGGKEENPEKAARRAEVEARRGEAEQRRAEADARRAERDQQRQQREAEREERDQRELTDLTQRAQTPGMKLSDEEWQRLVVEGLAARDGGMIRLTPAGEEQARRVPQPVTRKSAGLLRVFKDARGADRWFTITTTAYEDRDGEIITTKGIAHAVAYGDLTGQRGVLRFWHVPGIDLGPCDYQAQGGPGGRWLVESGTFYGPREAALGRAMAAKGWQMSPGFYHPEREPYPADVAGRRLGLYDHPMIFERSPCPPGRASNLFGRFSITKESRMNEEKMAALKELAGGDEALLADLLGRIEQTDKAAQTVGVAYKDAPAWAQQLIVRLEALEAREKAVAEKAPMDPAEMMEAGATELEDGAAEEGEDNLLSPGEIEAIATAVAEKLMGTMDGLTAKMAEVDAELKGRGYQRMKEFAGDGLESLTKTVTAIKATVDELNGLVPAPRTKGHRPTEDNEDLPPELVQALKELEGGGDDGLAAVGRWFTAGA